MAAGRFTFTDDDGAFETLKKAGGTVCTTFSNPKEKQLFVDIQIGGIRVCAYKTVKTEAAEHLLTDAIAERKAS